MIVSAVLGDLVSRSISLVIDKYQQKQMGGHEILGRLHGLLLRVQTIVDEAEGRRITNQAMLQQLKMLREDMYRGYYALDTFKYRSLEEKAKAKDDEEVNHSFALSRFNLAKRIFLSVDTTQSMMYGSLEGIKQMLTHLENILVDMKEFVIFLQRYPRICQQPYSTYLLLEKCMFGRQMEREWIINFLLESEHSGAQNVGVLPIIGPSRVGKSTLVADVCNEARVRNHFSSIVFVTGNDLKGETLATLRESGVIKHQNHVSHGRLLVVIELVRAVDEETWRRLYSSTTHMAPESKVIITSRSDMIANFGTTQSLRLKCLSQEAYWYLFKTLAFGSTNPHEQPKLVSIAMEIASELRRTFLSACIVGGLLRANINAQFWCGVLTLTRQWVKKNVSQFGVHPLDLWEKNLPTYVWRMAKSEKFFLVCSYYQIDSALDKVEEIRMHDVLSGRAKPQGKFEVLTWKSQIPPYYSYMVSCMIHTPRHTAARKKGLRLHGGI